MTVVGIVSKVQKTSAVSGKFVCNECSRSFKTKAALSNHTKAHERRRNREVVANGQ